MNNVTIANNTFVNSTGAAGVIIGVGAHVNVNFKNNLTLQDGTLLIIGTVQNSELHFSNNLWSKAPLSAAVGPGDVVGDPRLLKTGSQFYPQWFKLSSASPAIDKATYISFSYLDYFRNHRGSSPDIGANEINPLNMNEHLYLPAIIRR